MATAFGLSGGSPRSCRRPPDDWPSSGCAHAPADGPRERDEREDDQRQDAEQEPEPADPAEHVAQAVCVVTERVAEDEQAGAEGCDATDHFVELHESLLGRVEVTSG